MTKNQQILAKMGGGSLAILLSLGLGQQASATTLVSNLPNTTTSGYRVKNDNWLGSSFKTGNGSYGYTLNSVTLWFALEPGTSVDPRLLSLKLYHNAGGQPGTEISGGSFNVPVINAGPTALYTFTLTNSQQLAANTNYWLVAQSSVTTHTYLWGNTTDTAETGAAGWSIGDTSVFSTNQGTSWNSSWINPAGAFQFSVNGTENPPPTNIPEPGSVVALLGLGGLGLASRLKKLSTRA